MHRTIDDWLDGSIQPGEVVTHLRRCADWIEKAARAAPQGQSAGAPAGEEGRDGSAQMTAEEISAELARARAEGKLAVVKSLPAPEKNEQERRQELLDQARPGVEAEAKARKG